MLKIHQRQKTAQCLTLTRSSSHLVLALILLEMFLLTQHQIQQVEAFRKLKMKKILKKISPVLTLLTFLKTKKKIIPLPIPLPIPMPMNKNKESDPCPPDYVRLF